jgi:hypothetical protein
MKGLSARPQSAYSPARHRKGRRAREGRERYLSLQEHELLLSRDQGFIHHLTGAKVVLYMFI